MKLFENIKAKTKTFIANQQREFSEKQAYNQKLRKEVEEVKRQAYLEEAKKQARLQTKRVAKEKFNPKKKANSIKIPDIAMEL